MYTRGGFRSVCLAIVEPIFNRSYSGDDLKSRPTAMPIIRLIREVRESGGSGPWNGQYALQKALRRHAPDWLRIGGALGAEEIPWFWCWLDGDAAVMCAQTGQPFVVGPNILFANSRRPCATAAERAICAAASCRLLFTESPWYADLIAAHRGPANRAPIALWPYPIDPLPGEPLPAEFDLLVYQKGSGHPELIAQLLRRFSKSRLIVYGRYRREELVEAARRSRCCVYLSEDDRGPLALAEILLAGCPAVGVPTGAPFIQPRSTGVVVERLLPQSCIEAVLQCHALDRRAVAALAARQFDAQRIVTTIVESLAANCS
jgi:hypothetical protein